VRVRSRHTKYNVLNDFSVNRFGLFEKRKVALGKGNVALGKINVILGKNVANVVLGKKEARE
jgi:hypothetical protein